MSKKLFITAAFLMLLILAACGSRTQTQTSTTEDVNYDKIFLSKYIDDTGVKTAINLGNGQFLNQLFHDGNYDITVYFASVLTDEKETKLLLTYQSEKTNLKDHYIDLFEGVSSIYLVVGDERKKLENVGWGSNYYNSKENVMAEALSFESIKKYEGQDIRLEIENLTIWDDSERESLQTKWSIDFKLDQSAVSKRETVKLNKEFTFENVTYNIKQIEFSAFETRVVVVGSDTKLLEEGGEQYKVMSKLEHQFLNARKVDKEYGYIVNDKKSGVFLKSAGEKVDPVFSKGEVEGAENEYIMIFAPVKDRQDTILEVGDDVKIPLTE